MQRIAIATITAATVGAILLTGCADDSDDDNPCHGQPIVYVEHDDDGSEYRCGSTTGAVVPLIIIDADTQKRAKLTPGKAVPFKPAPVPKVKVDVKKPPAAAPKPAAPAAPKPPAPARPAPKAK